MFVDIPSSGTYLLLIVAIALKMFRLKWEKYRLINTYGQKIPMQNSKIKNATNITNWFYSMKKTTVNILIDN